MNKTIKLYGDESCIYCSKAKEWLEKHDVNFMNKDITKNENMVEFQKYGVGGIPLIVVVNHETKEEKLINGFSANQFEAEFLQ